MHSTLEEHLTCRTRSSSIHYSPLFAANLPFKFLFAFFHRRGNNAYFGNNSLSKLYPIPLGGIQH